MNQVLNQEIVEQIQLTYENIPLAVFLLGTNGSGKSSLRNYLNLSDIQTNIDPDVLNLIYKNKHPRSYQIEAGKQALKMCNEALANGLNLCVESTLAGRGTIQRIMAAKHLGYHTIAYFVGLNSVELNLERIALRVASGGHDIAENTVRNRYIESAKNLCVVQQYLDTIHVVDNSSPYFKLQFSKTRETEHTHSSPLESWANLLNTQLSKGDI